MYQVVKQSYQERYDMYNKCSKATLISYLTERDKYKHYVKTLPWYLVYPNYNNFTKHHLVELLSERDMYESPDACT